VAGGPDGQANPDAPSSRSGHVPWPTASFCTWLCPAWPDERPFILIDPARLDVPPRRAASITARRVPGGGLALGELQPVDLVVCGSVAVNREGPRLGKG